MSFGLELKEDEALNLVKVLNKCSLVTKAELTPTQKELQKACDYPEPVLRKGKITGLFIWQLLVSQFDKLQLCRPLK